MKSIIFLSILTYVFTVQVPNGHLCLIAAPLPMLGDSGWIAPLNYATDIQTAIDDYKTVIRFKISSNRWREVLSECFFSILIRWLAKEDPYIKVENQENTNSGYPDVVVRNNDRKTMLVVELKSLGRKYNAGFSEQICRYITDAQAKHGDWKVYGMLTNLSHARVYACTSTIFQTNLNLRTPTKLRNCVCNYSPLLTIVPGNTYATFRSDQYVENVLPIILNALMGRITFPNMDLIKDQERCSLETLSE